MQQISVYHYPNNNVINIQMRLSRNQENLKRQSVGLAGCGTRREEGVGRVIGFAQKGLSFRSCKKNGEYLRGESADPGPPIRTWKRRSTEGIV